MLVSAFASTMAWSRFTLRFSVISIWITINEICFALILFQTKKYADVIIPRGADNIGVDNIQCSLIAIMCHILAAVCSLVFRSSLNALLSPRCRHLFLVSSKFFAVYCCFIFSLLVLHFQSTADYFQCTADSFQCTAISFQHTFSFFLSYWHFSSNAVFFVVLKTHCFLCCNYVWLNFKTYYVLLWYFMLIILS